MTWRPKLRHGVRKLPTNAIIVTMYPTTFVYGGDRSGADGKDIKHFLLQSDILNKFGKKVYDGYIDDRDFYNESELFVIMFSDTDTDLLWEMFH